MIDDDIRWLDVSVSDLGNLVAVVKGLENIDKVPSNVTTWLNLTLALPLTDKVETHTVFA